MKPIIFVKHSNKMTPEEIDEVGAQLKANNPEVSFVFINECIEISCILPEGYTVQAVKFEPNSLEVKNVLRGSDLLEMADRYKQRGFIK